MTRWLQLLCLQLITNLVVLAAVNYRVKVIKIDVKTKLNHSALGWIAVGFSDYGKLEPSDLCILWTNWKGKVTMQDTWVDSKGIVSIDKNQNCHDFKFNWGKDNVLTFTFLRNFDTCDKEDYVIEDGTTHVVWAKGVGPLYGLQGLNISSANQTGFQRTTLLYNNRPSPSKPSNTFTMEIRSNGTRVPSEETTYWCSIVKLPKKLTRKHHVIQYEKASEENKGTLVHHMEVFHCATKADKVMPMYDGPCHAPNKPPAISVCSRVISAWAMGAPPFAYPEDAGMPIGGPGFNPYVMLEVHYHNPEHVKDEIDKSGIRMHLTPTLRKYDAGILELGLEYTDKMAIPPKQPTFSLTGFCISECSSVGLPPTGITVFGSQLHTHMAGAKVFTKHVRGGVELPELNRDNHYSQHMQEIRRLKHLVKVMPGDALITTCVYNTMDRDSVTLTGFSISDEMCVNYIHYYPHTNLEVCKSSLTEQDLQKYFQWMEQWEGQKLSAKSGISEKYKGIEWNPKRVKDLHKLYQSAPLSMQCNKSSGERFPGGWEGLPKTDILLPLPVPERKCSSLSPLQQNNKINNKKIKQKRNIDEFL